MRRYARGDPKIQQSADLLFVIGVFRRFLVWCLAQSYPGPQTIRAAAYCVAILARWNQASDNPSVFFSKSQISAVRLWLASGWYTA